MKSFLYISLPDQKDFQCYQEDLEKGEFIFKFSPFDQKEKQINLKMSLVDDLKTFIIPNSQIFYDSYSQEEYQILIEKTIQNIKEDRLGKVVISRSKQFPADKFDALKGFKSLVENYPNACVYLFGHEDCGVWMGATPETLVQGKGNEISTLSLAGTKVKGCESEFGPKEFAEQQLVTDFINEIFENNPGLEEIKIGDREISQAGNLVHLCTKIKAQKTEQFNLEQFLMDYHPTPAVGGNPKKQALKLISKLENHSRSYYSGYFGLKKKDSFHYFVNLRCMQLFDKSVVLYAGGGITAESQAFEEWQETESKMKTLLNVLEDQL